MARSITIREFILLSAVVILTLVQLRSCEVKKLEEKWQSQNDLVLQDTISYFKNRLGQQVAEKATYQGDDKKMRKLIAQNEQLNEAIRKFKKIETAAQIISETRIVLDTITFEQPIEHEFNRPFYKHSDDYTIGGSVDQDQVAIDSLNIPNKQSIVVGEKKLGLFKSEYRVEVTNSNPLIKVTGLKSYDFEVENKRWAIGAIGGYGISPSGASPFIGVGVSYDLWEF